MTACQLVCFDRLLLNFRLVVEPLLAAPDVIFLDEIFDGREDNFYQENFGEGVKNVLLRLPDRYGPEA